MARRGDGTQLLLRRYGLNPNTHLQAFLALNRANLSKGKDLIAGRKYRLPNASPRAIAGKPKPSAATAGRTASVRKTAPVPLASLFGSAYGRVAVRDQALRGAILYVSSGHGGPDPGAIGKYGGYSLAEDEYAYDVALRLARVLTEHGALVYMIIQDPNDGIRDQPVLLTDYDEVTYPQQPIPRSQLARLRQRINAVNKLHGQHRNTYQRFLGLHVDSRSESQNIDVFFYHNSASAAGQRLAERIHQTFTTRYKRSQPNRAYSGKVSSRNTLYVVRNSHPPAVFMELGNIQNLKDQRRFVIPDNRQAMANWICEGIIADYRARR
ncbi:N-acetylmuramoyl-L-alanine amidase [Hymenobacter jejuensis]|uniref:N-acetylmuramoyl-L-alanine amidase n=1 Tax=Hymenobacter jejuensis TaxID=2502781 RepID=A0A5B8A5S9_9BACT|nr:N-acetylmuramoyl-L-alanine amidase [Hymenobacter jejuensis]